MKGCAFFLSQIADVFLWLQNENSWASVTHANGIAKSASSTLSYPNTR